MAIGKKSSTTTNIIGEDSYFNGRFFINGSLRIDGKFEGRTLQADQLHVGASGKIKTDITVSSIVVEGIVIGNIVARKRIMLLPTARILGNLKTPELIIQNGVILEGACMISHDLKSSARQFIENGYSHDQLTLQKLFGNNRSS